MSHILVVDDEPAICWSLREAFTDDGHHVVAIGSLQQAFTSIEKQMPDVVIIDVRLPDGNGIDAIPLIRERLRPETPIVLMTAFGDLETAVRAVQAGVFEYLTKPFHLDDAIAVVRRGLAAKVIPALSPQRAKASEGLLGVSPAMQVVFKRIALVAASDTPVLVTGESGAGKEEVALAIHRHSSRANNPFVPVCVGALSETVIESELFGHVKGAFTGAEQTRTGLLELAHGGTVFLDELGDIPLPAQVKLLRAIERREVTPVGNPVPRGSDFRVIAATHRPLYELVQQGKFREDLLYRIRVFEIVVPPLRARVEDIPLLAEHFLRQIPGRRGSGLSADVMRELCARSWYGNVRELRNAVEYAAILARDTEIQPEHLPQPMPNPRSHAGGSFEEQIRASLQAWAQRHLTAAAGEERDPDLYQAFLRLTEPAVIQAALENANGNRVAAAKALGIHRSTLREKLKE